MNENTEAFLAVITDPVAMICYLALTAAYLIGCRTLGKAEDDSWSECGPGVLLIAAAVLGGVTSVATWGGPMAFLLLISAALLPITIMKKPRAWAAGLIERFKKRGIDNPTIVEQIERIRSLLPELHRAEIGGQIDRIASIFVPQLETRIEQLEEAYNRIGQLIEIESKRDRVIRSCHEVESDTQPFKDEQDAVQRRLRETQAQLDACVNFLGLTEARLIRASVDGDPMLLDMSAEFNVLSARVATAITNQQEARAEVEGHQKAYRPSGTDLLRAG